MTYTIPLISAAFAFLVLFGAPSFAAAHEAKTEADVRAHADAGLHLGHLRAALRHGTAAQGARLVHVTAGVITSIDGSAFTINPFGPAATTTVTTDSSTVFKARHGHATTSAALAAGTRVVVLGSTTGSADSETFTASVVRIFADGWAHLRVWLGLGLHAGDDD